MRILLALLAALLYVAPSCEGVAYADDRPDFVPVAVKAGSPAPVTGILVSSAWFKTATECFENAPINVAAAKAAGNEKVAVCMEACADKEKACDVRADKIVNAMANNAPGFWQSPFFYVIVGAAVGAVAGVTVYHFAAK